jgi:hypothetical protein
MLHIDCQTKYSSLSHNPFINNDLEEVFKATVLPCSPEDLKIHWISANVQMERFYH